MTFTIQKQQEKTYRNKMERFIMLQQFVIYIAPYKLIQTFIFLANSQFISLSKLERQPFQSLTQFGCTITLTIYRNFRPTHFKASK